MKRKPFQKLTLIENKTYFHEMNHSSNFTSIHKKHIGLSQMLGE